PDPLPSDGRGNSQTLSSRLLTRCLIIRSLSVVENLVRHSRVTRTGQKSKVRLQLLLHFSAHVRNRLRRAPGATLAVVFAAIIHSVILHDVVAQEINP